MEAVCPSSPLCWAFRVQDTPQVLQPEDPEGIGLLLGFPPLICKHGAHGRIRPTIQEAAEGPSLPRVPHVSRLRRWEGVSLGSLLCCLASVASIYVTKKHCPRTPSPGIPSLANAAQTGLVRTELSLGEAVTYKVFRAGKECHPTPLRHTGAPRALGGCVLPSSPTSQPPKAAGLCPRPRGHQRARSRGRVSPSLCPLPVSPRQQRALGRALDVTLLMPLRPNERNRPEC